jgi:hypothetical protein
MCENCFISEIKQFQNDESWSVFQLALTSKLDHGLMKKVKLRDQTDSLYIHQCATCKENWVLQPPAMGQGGSFLTLSSVLKKLAVPAWRRRLSIVVLLLVILVVILELLSGW